MKPHIVLIEDNEADAFLLRRALKKAAITHELTHIEDGEEALRALSGELAIPAPDLILLDLNLPRRNGKEVLRAVRGNCALARTPVAVLTSSSAARDREEALSLGADRYIFKPIDVNDLSHVVTSAVRELLALGPAGHEPAAGHAREKN